MSKIILGTVQMGLNYGINNKFGKIPIDESYQILLKAYLFGITSLDTAEAYGDAHQLIGSFHKNNPNYKFNIITKVPHSFEASSIEIKVNEYLKSLEVSYLEVLMFHSFQSFVENSQVIVILTDLKSKGYINHIGVSVYTNEQLEYLLNIDEITVIQLPFNLLDNNNLRGDIIKKLKAKGKIIHTRSAFLQGLFFKKLNEQDKDEQNLYSELQLLNQISLQSKCSIEELALSYCIQQENIDNVIFGVDSLIHLEANLKASSYIIGEESMKKIETIKVSNLDLLNPSLW
jgi:aryl-alcohol dehydrogenase-like predicted oxidoreductase